MSHHIRLRGPWSYQPVARTVLLSDGHSAVEAGDLPPPGRLHMPADWGHSLGPDFRGRVRYIRHFHRPTGLDGARAVRLVIDQVDTWAWITLNGRALGVVRDAGFRACFDVTNCLRPGNELTVEVELPRVTDRGPPLARPSGREGKPGGLVGEVRLEID